MKLIKVKGFILRGFPFGESHKMITLFSGDLGKIKFIAHGVRKTKSKYGSTFELLNEVSVVLTPTKKGDLYNIKDFSLILSFHSIRENLKIIKQCYYIAEFLDLFIHEATGRWHPEEGNSMLSSSEEQGFTLKDRPPIAENRMYPKGQTFVSREDHSDKEIYHLLKTTLLKICKHLASYYELTKSFELKSLMILGFLSDLKQCSQCDYRFLSSNPDRSIYLSTRSGWLFCDNCKNYHTDHQVSLGTYRFLLNLLQFEVSQILKLKIDSLFRKETDLSFEKLIISILGKKLNSANWLTV